MTVAARFETAAAVVGTVAAAIAAVWLTGDPRAFGVVIALAGLAVGIALGRLERGTAHPPRVSDAGRRASAGTDVTRAA